MEIFVGNLPFTAEKSTIEALFAGFGEITNVRMMFDEQKRFRGMAYVEFADADAAKAAIAAQNGAEFEGRKLRVDHAKPAAPRFNGFGGGFAKPRARRGFGGKRPQKPAAETKPKLAPPAYRYGK